MSNHLAIATVTATLQDLLQEAASGAVSGATVTTQRPEAASNGAQNDPKINIYLYQVMLNAAWRNSDIVIRQADPTALQNRGKDKVEYRPLVPLNLHYLISFYGAESELQPQRLLGGAVGAMQLNARLPLPRVQAAINSRGYLATSDLDHQLERIEHVQLTPIKLDLEEMSKIWSVFFQVPYALSIAYEAAVVLIESNVPRLVPVVTDPDVAVKQLKGVYLFSIPLALQSDLDQGNVTSGLRQAFADHNFALSAQATVTIIAPGTLWQIEDPVRKTVFEPVQRYRVERDTKMLDIYDASAEQQNAGATG